MRKDLKLFDKDKDEAYVYPYKKGILKEYQLESDDLDNQVAEDYEVIANKVVKYLLTSRGSDPMNKEYGSDFMEYKYISKYSYPKFVVDVKSDLKRCYAYVKKTEPKLKAINLVGVEYLFEYTPNIIDIYINIQTTDNVFVKFKIQK